jgi:CRP-like cAMP-binding protein
MALQSRAVARGEDIVTYGDSGCEMFIIYRGEVEALDRDGKYLSTLREGDCFGELALLLSGPRQATIRAKTQCNLFVLDKASLGRILRDHQQFAQALSDIVRERYHQDITVEQLTSLS